MICESGDPPPADFEAFLQRVPAQDHDIVRGALDEALARRSYDIEHRVNVGAKPAGSARSRLRNRSGDEKTSRIAGTIQDVTERVKAQHDLRAAEARYRSLVEQSLAGIYIIPGRQRWAYVNPRLAEILGYDSAEELMAVDPLETAPEADHARVLEFRRSDTGGHGEKLSATRAAAFARTARPSSWT